MFFGKTGGNGGTGFAEAGVTTLFTKYWQSCKLPGLPPKAAAGRCNIGTSSHVPTLHCPPGHPQPHHGEHQPCVSWRGGWWKQRGDETSLFGVYKQLRGAERGEVTTSVQLRTGVFSVRAYEGSQGGLSSSRGLLYGCRSVLLQQASSPHLIPRKCTLKLGAICKGRIARVPSLLFTQGYVTWVGTNPARASLLCQCRAGCPIDMTVAHRKHSPDVC